MNPARAWPIAIVAVLAITVAANAYLLYEATDRNGAVVEPDYYRKAVGWDSTADARARSDSLGWRLAAAIGPLDPAGTGWITARLVDRNGRAITGATVRVTAIHNLEAGRHVEAVLPAAGDGYAAPVPLHHSGQWELRFDVRRGHDRFGADLRRDAAPGVK